MAGQTPDAKPSHLTLITNKPETKSLKLENVHPDLLNEVANLARNIEEVLLLKNEWEVFSNTVGDKLMQEIQRNREIMGTRRRVGSVSVSEVSPQTAVAETQIGKCTALHQQWRALNLQNRGLLWVDAQRAAKQTDGKAE